MNKKAIALTLAMVLISMASLFSVASGATDKSRPIVKVLVESGTSAPWPVSPRFTLSGDYKVTTSTSAGGHAVILTLGGAHPWNTMLAFSFGTTDYLYGVPKSAFYRMQQSNGHSVTNPSRWYITFTPIK